MADEMVPLRIAALSMSRAEVHSLGVLLPRRLDRTVEILTSSTESCDLFLVGVDAAQGRSLAQHLSVERPEIPMIQVGVQRPASVRGGYFAHRPLRADELARTIGEALYQNEPEMPLRTRGGRLEREYREYATHDFDRCIAGRLREAVHIARDNRVDLEIKGIGTLLVLQEGRIYSVASPRALCSIDRVTRGRCKRQDPLAIEYRELASAEVCRLMKTTQQGRMYETEYFLWVTAIGCAQGRFPQGYQPDTKVQLTSWPDCTQLPHSMAVVVFCSVFSRGAVRLDTAAAELGVPWPVLADFVNAAHAIGLLRKESRLARQPTSRQNKWRWARDVLSAVARHFGRRAEGSMARQAV